jgi:peptidoglycan-associated lipoprotein
MRKSVLMAFALVVSVAVMPACASKKFVRTSVGEVNSKVDSVSKTVEDTQSRTKANEEKIGQVDQKAEAAAKSAASAGSAASAAAAAARAADEKAAAVSTRVAAVEQAAKRLILEVTLSEDQGNFDRAKADLPDAAKGRIDQLINQLKGDPKSVFIEIEGHTDNTGSSEYNDRLGLERAEAVKRYIYEQHQIPLHRINVISYGETKPVAPNNTREGRAQNRRVVIRVLS